MRKLLFVLAATLIAPVALADDTQPAHVRVLHDIIIVGRPMKPLAATDVAKLPMQSTLTELRQPLVQRIELTVQNSPF